MSSKSTQAKESIDTREERANCEVFEAVVATEGIVNVCNQSKADPSAHSVFIDLLDAEAVACSCPDWEHCKPAGGCKHIKFVNDNDALLAGACTPSVSEEGE